MNNDGPLLPPGSPEVWVGGLSEAVIAVAARSADAWNGWGLDAADFAEKATALRRAADGREVAATWGGIALVGEDTGDLDRLIADRRGRGMSTEGVWTGTSAQLRDFVDELADSGATWFVVLPVGPADRLELIADTLRTG